MARKKKPTRRMKIKDAGTSRDSRYAIKENNAKKKGIFTKFSPFNQYHAVARTQIAEQEILRSYEYISPPNIIDRMIEAKRGVSNDQLAQRKLKVDESEEETL